MSDLVQTEIPGTEPLKTESPPKPSSMLWHAVIQIRKMAPDGIEVLSTNSRRDLKKQLDAYLCPIEVLGIFRGRHFQAKSKVSFEFGE